MTIARDADEGLICGAAVQAELLDMLIGDVSTPCRGGLEMLTVNT